MEQEGVILEPDYLRRSFRKVFQPEGTDALFHKIIHRGNFKSHSKNGKDAIRKELQRVVCTCYLQGNSRKRSLCQIEEEGALTILRSFEIASKDKKALSAMQMEFFYEKTSCHAVRRYAARCKWMLFSWTVQNHDGKECCSA